MRPITALLAVIVLLATSFGARQILLGMKRRLGVEHLQQANALRIDYFVQGRMKSLTISDPNEVQAILATMRVLRTVDIEEEYDTRHRSYYWIGSQPGSVVFLFNGQRAVTTRLVNSTHITWLDHMEITLDPAFYRKICELLSEKEEKRIDVLQHNQ